MSNHLSSDELTKDAERFVKLVRLMQLNCDDKLTVGFINAEVDCRTLNDWRQYLDTVA